MKFSKSKLAILVPALAMGLTACNSDDSGDHQSQPQPQTITATFIDSAVAGLNYDCGNGQTGVTDENGQFTIISGSTCSFNIDGFDIGKVSNVTQSTSVITPYDTQDTAEDAIKVASLLQTIDADGNPDNGIDVTETKGSTIPGDLLDLDPKQDSNGDGTTDFEESLGKIEDKEGNKTDPNDIVSVDDAKKHLDQNVADKKGYHSVAVQEIVDDISSILPTIELVNLQSKLAEYQQILDNGDDSNNADIESLQAVLAIAEVLNMPEVSERVDITGNLFDYTEMLPKTIDASFNQTAEIIIDKEVAGTTDDASSVLFALAQKLIDASSKLGASFADENYVAQYTKDTDDKEGEKLTYQDAQVIRFTALTVANTLSLVSAYDAGSQELYFSQSETIESVPLIDVTLNSETGAQDITEKLDDINAEYEVIAYDPVTYFNDDSVFKLRDDAKYLATAKQALIDSMSVAEMIDLKLHFEDENEIKEIETLISDLNAHLQAADGAKNPFVYQEEDTKYTVNLHAFYSLDKGIDRTAFNITNNELTCRIGTYNEAMSKVLNKPACVHNEYAIDNGLNYENVEFMSYTCDENNCVTTFAPAIEADHNLEMVELDLLNFQDVLLSCKVIDQDGNETNCD